MGTRKQKNADPLNAAKENKKAAPQAGAGKEDACRCKETSVMTPRQLFGTLLSDLAFWKKKE